MFVILGCLVWSVTSPVLAIELRWNPKNIENITYKAAMEFDVTGLLNRIEVKELLSDSSGLHQAISNLKSLPLDGKYLHYRSRMHSRNNDKTLRVRLIGVPVEFEGEPVGKREAEVRELIQIYTNAIRLQGDMDLTGDSADLTFYRSPRERNIMTQLFYLPKNDVSIGDQWTLPVEFVIELGPGVFEQNATSYNCVKLHALRNSASGLVAELHYLVIASVDGYADRGEGKLNRPLPFKLDVSFFGYGEFLVEKGYWKRQVTVIDYTGSGHTKIHKQQLFALMLDEAEE